MDLRLSNDVFRLINDSKFNINVAAACTVCDKSKQHSETQRQQYWLWCCFIAGKLPQRPFAISYTGCYRKLAGFRLSCAKTKCSANERPWACPTHRTKLISYNWENGKELRAASTYSKHVPMFGLIGMCLLRVWRPFPECGYVLLRMALYRLRSKFTYHRQRQPECAGTVPLDRAQDPVPKKRSSRRSAEPPLAPLSRILGSYREPSEAVSPLRAHFVLSRYLVYRTSSANSRNSSVARLLTVGSRRYLPRINGR